MYGRRLHLYDCDEFTRSFYEKYNGVLQGSEVIEESFVVRNVLSWVLRLHNRLVGAPRLDLEAQDTRPFSFSPYRKPCGLRMPSASEVTKTL